MNNLTYKKYLEKFNLFLEIRNLTKNTIRSYKYFLIQYITWVEYNLKDSLEKVSYEDIRLYILYLKNIRKLAPASINSHISQLRFFHIYVLNKPLDKYQVPFMKITRKLPVILSKEDIFYFIDSFINLKHKVWAALLYSSGIRVSELQYLRYEDISRENMQIYIRETKSRSDRYAILSNRALKYLTDYWYFANKPRGFLFPGIKNEGPISNTTIQKNFRNQCEKINFKVKITPHSLRHHFGTHLYEDGNDLLTIQKLLGHKSINSTTLYVQLANPNKLNIISPFDSEVNYE